MFFQWPADSCGGEAEIKLRCAIVMQVGIAASQPGREDHAACRKLGQLDEKVRDGQRRVQFRAVHRSGAIYSVEEHPATQSNWPVMQEPGEYLYKFIGAGCLYSEHTPVACPHRTAVAGVDVAFRS